MTIRPYQQKDRTKCIEIFNSNCPDFFDSSELIGLHTWLDGLDKGQINYKNSVADYFYVLTDTDAQIMACGGFYCVKNEQRANLVWGMVNRDFHGQGIGKKMLVHRIMQMKKIDHSLSISLDTSQHTYGFFEKLGFRVTSIALDFYGPGLDRYDMSK